MNTSRIRKAAEKTTVASIVKYALAAETDLDEETKQTILVKAAQALIYDEGDTTNLIEYIRTLAFAAEITPDFS